MNIYSPHYLLVLAISRKAGPLAILCPHKGEAIQDIGYELLRIPLLRPWVNKDDYAFLTFLVNEEHALAKPVRGGHEASLGVLILRLTLFKLLV